MIEAMFVGRRPAAGVAVAGVLWSILAAAPAAAALPVTAEPSLPMITIAAGTTSQIEVPTRAVVRDRSAWAALWRRHEGRADAPPAVDFDREMVVAVFAGASSEPIALSITRIAREANRLVVTYTLGPTRPMADAVGPVTAPFHIVRVARSTLPVTFVLHKLPQVLRPGSYRRPSPDVPGPRPISGLGPADATFRLPAPALMG